MNDGPSIPEDLLRELEIGSQPVKVVAPEDETAIREELIKLSHTMNELMPKKTPSQT